MSTQRDEGVPPDEEQDAGEGEQTSDWTDEEFAQYAREFAGTIRPETLSRLSATIARVAPTVPTFSNVRLSGLLAAMPTTAGLDATMKSIHAAALSSITPVRWQSPSLPETMRPLLGWDLLHDQAHSLPTNWSKIASQLLSEASRVKLAESLTRIRATFLPPNVARCTSPKIKDLFTIAEHEGLALFLVPGPAVVTVLLDAPDPEARRAVLLERADEILTDCEALLDTCVAPEVIPYVPYARKAVRAARAEHHEAAQALAANTLDSMFKNVSSLIPVREFFKTPEMIRSELLAHQLVIWPAEKAHQQFWVHKGDKIPSTFSRHGSAHAVGAVQYTPTNAVQGLLLLVSLIGYVHERARATSL